MTTITRFDVADYLESEEMIAEYLSISMEDPDPAVFLMAVAAVARARGMTQLAKDTGLGRESLYKALSGEGNPSFATILKVMSALGLKLHAAPLHASV